MPDLGEQLLTTILEEVKEIKGTQNETTLEVASLKQTLHGPPGSNNGLYGTVTKLSGKIDALDKKITDEVVPVIRDAKKGMSFREKLLLIFIAAIPALVSLAVAFFK